MNRWQFVLHQRALEEIDKLRPAERRAVRAALLQLVENPWQTPDGQIRRQTIGFIW
jgi:mRNA-degrading endonuclease RelE of RelBE toxin-antitoxin system